MSQQNNKKNSERDIDKEQNQKIKELIEIAEKFRMDKKKKIEKQFVSLEKDN